MSSFALRLLIPCMLFGCGVAPSKVPSDEDVAKIFLNSGGSQKFVDARGEIVRMRIGGLPKRALRQNAADSVGVPFPARDAGPK